MNRTLQKVLLVLLLAVVALQTVLLVRIRTPSRVDQVVWSAEQQSARRSSPSARASTLQPAIEKRFDRIDDRLAQIEKSIATLGGSDRRISRSDRQSGPRFADSAGVSTLQSAIEKRLDRIDNRIAALEKKTEALTEIDQKITRLGTNLGSRLSDSWPGSTLHSDIERRFNHLDERLARIENKLK